MLNTHLGLLGQDTAQINQLKNIFFSLPVGKSATQMEKAIQRHPLITKDSDNAIEEGEFRGVIAPSTKSDQVNNYELFFDHLDGTYDLALYAIHSSKTIAMAQYQYLIGQFRKVSPKTQPYKHSGRIGCRFFDSPNAHQPYLTIYLGSRGCVPEIVVAIEYEYF